MLSFLGLREGSSFFGGTMFITTASRYDSVMQAEAQRIADRLDIPFYERKRFSIEGLLQLHHSESCIVNGKERMEIYFKNEKQPFFFHPNSASFRIKRLLKGEKDPLIEAAGLLSGMSFLDCTAGLGSDSIAASFAVGSTGNVLSIESSPYIHFIVKNGLENWKTDLLEMKESMEKIKLLNADFLDILKKLPDNAVDVVYFDPMFEETINESNGISAMKSLAVYGELTEAAVKEAKRAAKKRVVLKDHYKSERFQKLGFQVLKRKSAKFHFGIINV